MRGAGEAVSPRPSANFPHVFYIIYVLYEIFFKWVSACGLK